MNIHILCNDGSPINKLWSDVHGAGVGGAELALISLAEQFTKDGNKVSIYNRDDMARREEVGIKFEPISIFDPMDEDRILIVFRSPSPLLGLAEAHRKIWWSTDQYTIGSFQALATQVEFVVTISPFHTRYHMDHYHIPAYKMAHIDIGVRDEYDLIIKKQKNLCIFCSVPDRGLRVLHAAWPLIQREVPDATLVITSDYRLWGLPSPNNHKYRLEWTDHSGVNFLGKVSRAELVKLQLAAELQLYPCTYEELFCISTAECGVAGAYPVTSGYGALPTTNQWGTILAGDPTHPGFVGEFTARAISLMTADRAFLEDRQATMAAEARDRFSYPRIAERWYELFENGRIESEL